MSYTWVLEINSRSATKGILFPYATWHTLQSSERTWLNENEKIKVKLSRYRAEQTLGGSGRLRLRIFMTFGTMEVVGRHPYAPAVFNPRSILVLIFRGWVNSRAHGSVGSYGKKSAATPLGIDPETLRLVGQSFNRYATPGPLIKYVQNISIRTYRS
jgi:hypothetical protein